MIEKKASGSMLHDSTKWTGTLGGVYPTNSI